MKWVLEVELHNRIVIGQDQSERFRKEGQATERGGEGGDQKEELEN